MAIYLPPCTVITGILLFLFQTMQTPTFLVVYSTCIVESDHGGRGGRAVDCVIQLVGCGGCLILVSCDPTPPVMHYATNTSTPPHNKPPGHLNRFFYVVIRRMQWWLQVANSGGPT